MENNMDNQSNVQPEPVVSFPDPKPVRSGREFPKWLFAVIGLVVILAVGGFFLYQSSSTSTTNPTPSPFVSGLDTLPTPTETPTATKSPTPAPSATPTSAQRTGVSIEVQNGTGTTGDAALGKSLIEKAGYTKVTTGNATSQDATTTAITYSSDVPLAVVTEVAQAMAASFGPSTPQAGLSGKMMIRVVTGPKVAAAAARTTASPTSTPRASATPTPSGAPAASKTPSPTPAATPAT